MRLLTLITTLKSWGTLKIWDHIHNYPDRRFMEGSRRDWSLNKPPHISLCMILIHLSSPYVPVKSASSRIGNNTWCSSSAKCFTPSKLRWELGSNVLKSSYFSASVMMMLFLKMSRWSEVSFHLDKEICGPWWHHDTPLKTPRQTRTCELLVLGEDD